MACVLKDKAWDSGPAIWQDVDPLGHNTAFHPCGLCLTSSLMQKCTKNAGVMPPGAEGRSKGGEGSSAFISWMDWVKPGCADGQEHAKEQ